MVHRLARFVDKETLFRYVGLLLGYILYIGIGQKKQTTR